MFELLLAIFLGFASPSYTTNDISYSSETTIPTPDPDHEAGGDGSHIPPGRP